jgi:DNA-binding XRE family transcriptional regulator
MTTSNIATSLDFEKVELVRERMALTIKDMCKLLGVSRVTYYKWVEGGPIRERNEKKVKETLRQLLPLLKTGVWPPDGAKHMTSEQRLDAILEILGDRE